MSKRSAHKESKGGQIGQAREEKKERSRDQCWKRAQSSLMDSGREVNQVAVCTLCSPKHSCPSDQHILQWNPMIKSETRVEMEYKTATTMS